MCARLNRSDCEVGKSFEKFGCREGSTQKSMSLSLEDRKGEPFRYIGGANAAKKRTGWIDKGKMHSCPSKIYLLVDMEDGTVFTTWALKKNIGPIRSISETFWEAILAGCPEAELGMNTLAWTLAECQLPTIQPALEYIENQFKESVQILDDMGSKAKVRRIKYEPRAAGSKRSAGADPERGDPMELFESEGMFST